MAIKNRSEISTIQGPEFVNLEPVDLNPLMSKCQIKVFYLGKNRNGSYIDKSAANEMAKTLRGTPIVAAWYEEKQDFGDHGNVITIENGEVKFSCATVPYGFVAPDAEVWYQDYTDYDEFDNPAVHTYLCTTGYLWTGQYPEIQKAIDEGQPHSMELDSDSMEGHWAEDNSSGVEFFIINDATFSKLCILADDCPPCFEGSTVEPVAEYSLNDNGFKTTLFSMMKDLEETLKNDNVKGGEDMKEDVETATADFALEHEPAETDVELTDAEVEEIEETEEEATEEAEEAEESEDFACGNKKKKYTDDDDDDVDDDVKDDVDDDDDDKKKPAGQHSLEAEFAALKAEVEELRAYRLEQENAKKDVLINKYHMLSPEDKADVLAHKAEYSYDEIEAKLALAYVKNNVDFSTVDGKEEEVEEVEEDLISTFSLDDDVSFVPPAVAALREVKSKYNF